MKLWIWMGSTEDACVATHKPTEKTCGCCEGYQVGADGVSTTFCATGKLIFEKIVGIKFPKHLAAPVQIEITGRAKSKIVKRLRKARPKAAR